MGIDERMSVTPEPLESGEPTPAERLAASETASAVARRRTLILTGFSGFLLFTLGFVVFFFMNFKTIEVQGDSMYPTLDPGQRLLMTKAYWLVGDLEVGDIVVLYNQAENEVIIKRIYRLARGEVDLYNVPRNYDIRDGAYIVREGYIYVLGDNWEVSLDSRTYGEFPMEAVMGKVVVMNDSFAESKGQE